MLILHVGVSGGSHIEETAQDAITLATRMGCRVDFTFNGTSLFAMPLGYRHGINSTVEQIVQHFNDSRSDSLDNKE